MKSAEVIGSDKPRSALNPNGTKDTMSVNVSQPTDLLLLERQRDALAARLERLGMEPNPLVVEGFEYVAKDGLTGEQRASVARGRLMCSTLKAINDINAQICAVIYPHFAPRPSVSFTDKVMERLA